MKYVKFLNILVITFLVIVVFPECSFSQKNSKDSLEKASFKSMIESQNFVFQAQSVTPLRGGFRTLTSPYDVVVSKDTLRSYLPYFGRAYDPEYNVTKSALDFTSTDFSYSASPHKKNGWDIIIKPKDKTDIQQYNFTVYDNGSASLNVTSTSRDAISFNGSVEKRNKR